MLIPREMVHDTLGDGMPYSEKMCTINHRKAPWTPLKPCHIVDKGWQQTAKG